jgi:site-specific DNA recombinase
MARRRQPPKDFSDLTGTRAVLYCRVSHIQKKSKRSGDEAADEKSRAVDEKSVDDQEREGRAWADRTGVQLVEVFRDAGLSASKYATKDRPDFQRLLAFVEAGSVDVVWVWAVDRSQRDLRVFAEMRELFQKHQVALAVNSRLHDPNEDDDWMMLGITSMFGERYSVELSKNVTRGQGSSAANGQPHGSVTYGYRRRRGDNRPDGVSEDRVWIDKRTKQYVWQEPHYFDDEGRAVEDSPAWVVREIFRRILAGDSLSRIARDLNDRGVPLPRGAIPTPKSGWTANGLRKIALNPAYIGLRVRQHDWNRLEDAHRSALAVKGKWPALVDEGDFWTVHRELTRPERKHTRPAAAKSLLSCLVTCGKCGGQVVAGWTERRGNRYHTYNCGNLRCVGIKSAPLDEYVEEIIVQWLSDPGVFAELTRVDDSAVAAEARAEANELRVDLEVWRRKAIAGEIDANFYATIEQDRLRRIDAADKRGEPATIPAALGNLVGPEAEAAWNRASLEVKRQVIRMVADITLMPSDRSGAEARWYGAPVSERVQWRWLLGPDTDQAVAPPVSRPSPLRILQLRPADADALLEVARHGPFPQMELVSRLGISKSNMWNCVGRLVKRGWFEQQWGTGDSRTGRGHSPMLTLTEAGQQTVATLLGSDSEEVHQQDSKA